MKSIKTFSLFAKSITLCLVLLLSSYSYCQSKIDSLLSKIDPQKFALSISKKAESLEHKLVQKSLKVLDKMQHQEEKIYEKMLRGKDSSIAKAKLIELKNKYSLLKSNLKNPAIVKTTKQYIPKLDSFGTALKFLDQNGIGGKVQDALTISASLQNKFQQAEEIKKFIKGRKEQLKQQLEKLGMGKQLKQINKQVYYYAAQLKEYKDILKDPKKIEKKVLEVLSKTKLFQDFFRKNSMLASLFRMPGDPNDPAYLASLSGLQTRAQVNALVQQQIQGGGPNAMQQFQQNLQAAQGQMNQLKSKIGQFGGASSDEIMPDGFKPNGEKTKSFLKRLEIGTNVQSQKSNNLFPTTSDLAMSVGYKLNSKSVIGIGASYKLGLGHGWQHLKLSSEGVGLRSFIDLKLKGSFWITGGYEMNYKISFSTVEQLRNLNAWQRSGLIGISKSIPIKSKFFKKTKIQLLWDFLSYTQIPRTQPVVFRSGYNFK